MATGAEGKVYRVDAQGKAQTLLTSAETHVTALAVDAAGHVYAGSAPGGILYRIDPAGKVFVLHDSPYREVKALDAGGGRQRLRRGDRRQAREGRAPRGVPPMPRAVPARSRRRRRGHGDRELHGARGATAAPQRPCRARGPDARAPGPAKGALLRMLPSGEVDTLWSSSEETPHALAASPDGVLVGTGNKGKLYRVRDDRTWTMVAAFPAEQVTALLRADGERAGRRDLEPGPASTC